MLRRSLVAGSVRLTGTSVNYSVVKIKNRDSRLISKKFSLRSSFSFISCLAALVRIALL